MECRIDIFKQIRSFFGRVFDNTIDFKPSHISLYMFLLNQNNRSNWSTWFKCPCDTGMMGAGIDSAKTYYKTLNELSEFGLIKYEKGLNHYKAPKISLIKLYEKSESDNIPIPENDFSQVNNTIVNITELNTLLTTGLTTRLMTGLTTGLHTNKDILITLNNKQIVVDKIIDFVKTIGIEKRNGNFKPPTILEISEYCKLRKNTIDAEHFFSYYESNGWMVGKNKMKNWQACIRTWEQRNKLESKQEDDKHFKPIFKNNGNS